MLPLLLVLSLVGLGVFLLWYFVFGGKGKAIQAKFQRAGDLRGKTVAQIEAFAGKPLRMVSQGDKQVGTWGHYGYNIVLVFKNGVCEGVSKEVNF